MWHLDNRRAYLCGRGLKNLDDDDKADYLRPMNIFRQYIFLVFIVLLPSFSLSGCDKTQKTVDNTLRIKQLRAADPGDNIVQISPEAATAISLTCDKADIRTVDFTVKTTGEVLANANLTTHVNSPVTGRITEVMAAVGEHVVVGQKLLMIRSQDIEQAESDLLQSQAQVRADLKRDLLEIDSDIEQGQAQIRFSQSTYLRVKGLLEEKIASRADFEAARTQYEKDRITLDALNTKRQATVSLSAERMRLLTEPIKQKLRLFGVAEDDVSRIMKSGEIEPIVPVVSPESGLVVERLVNVGELVDPSKSLFTIADFHNVWLKADVYEKDVSKVTEGQPIQLTLESFPGETFLGKLNYVADSINSDTRTLSVRAEVANPGLKLKPKMFAKMTILVGAQQVLTVPKEAVQDTDTCKVVYIPEGDNCFREQKVELGGETGKYFEVLKGLHPGETVVTKGSFDLRSEALKESE